MFGSSILRTLAKIRLKNYTFSTGLWVCNLCFCAGLDGASSQSALASSQHSPDTLDQSHGTNSWRKLVGKEMKGGKEKIGKELQRVGPERFGFWMDKHQQQRHFKLQQFKCYMPLTVRQHTDIMHTTIQR